VAEHLAMSITAYNRAQSAESPGPVGAVVGATLSDAGKVAESLPLSYLLAPGVGAQGATIDDIAARFGAARTRVLPSLSRGIIAQGTSESEIRAVIQSLGEKAKRLLL
jgi:orotidine-5'-phosphate decarboxylase